MDLDALTVIAGACRDHERLRFDYHPSMLALYLGLLDADFEIVNSPELRDAVRALAERFQRAADRDPT